MQEAKYVLDKIFEVTEKKKSKTRKALKVFKK